MTDTTTYARANYRHLPLVRHALGVKLALDLDDRPAGRAELAELLHAATLASARLGPSPETSTDNPTDTEPTTYDPADVMRAGPADPSSVQHVTTYWLGRFSRTERARGHRRGRVDLARSLGYDSPEALALAVRSHRARARTESA
jgi:hypothetical protein